MEAARLGQARQEASAQLALVAHDRVHPDRAHVLARRDETGEELVRQGAGLEAVAERLVGCGADLVRAPAFQQLRPGEGDPEMRAEELARRSVYDGVSESQQNPTLKA